MSELNIEQLLSSKLGEAEIAPSLGAWTGIQRKLRWKLFLRFHPGRFNIYYLAGLVLTGASLVLLFSDRKTEPALPSRIPMEAPANKNQEIEQLKSLESPAPGNAEPLSPASDQKPGLMLESSPEASNPKDMNATKNQQDLAELSSDPQEALEPVPMEEILPEAAVPPAQVIRSPSQNLVASFSASAYSGCVPLEVKFYNQSNNAISYEWAFGNGVKSRVEEPEHLFDEPGKYTVTLRAVNSEGQSLVDLRTIEVYPNPKADFSIEEGFEGVDGHVSLALLNYSVGATSYAWRLLTEDRTVCTHWDSEEFQPALKLTDIKSGASKIRLEVSSEFGCGSSAEQALPVLVESKEVRLKFATAFSPNPTGPGDGTFSPHEKRTDLFHPVFLEAPTEYHIRVYTKRGELVFETRDIYQGWDGYFHQERSAGGVYVWMVDGTWKNGETFTMQGDVTLIWQDFW